VPDFITNERAEEVFGLLDEFYVRLEKDPTVMGPSYVHEKLKECRDYSIEIEELLIEFYDVQRRVKNMLTAHKRAYEAEKSELLVLDDEVRKGKSASDRTAIAEYKLKDDQEKINNLEEQLVNVRYVLKAVELKKEGMNRTNNDIKKQVSLMEFAKSTVTPLEEVEDEDLPFENGTAGSTPLDDDDEDVSALFEDEPTAPPEAKEPEDSEPVEDDELARRLALAEDDGVTEAHANPPEDDEEDLVPEDPPEEIPEEVERHMADDDEPDPLEGDLEADLDGLGDIDDFLNDITVELDPEEEEPEVENGGVTVVADDDDEEDLDALLGTAPLDEKEDKKASKKKGKKTPVDDDDVVDIGSFLSEA